MARHPALPAHCAAAQQWPARTEVRRMTQLRLMELLILFDSDLPTVLYRAGRPVELTLGRSCSTATAAAANIDNKQTATDYLFHFI